MKRHRLFDKARDLRQAGHSLKEISERLKISKSTASLWLKEVSITKEGLNRLDALSEKGLINSKLVLGKRRADQLRMIEDKCSVLKKRAKYGKDECKIFLALLYWGEGSKTGRRVVFMNSDPAMIKSFLGLFRKAYCLNEDIFRAVLHLHGYHDEKEMVSYWSKLTKINKRKISVYRKENSGSRKKEGYRGCISIRYGDSRIFDELLIIIDRLKNKFADVG